VTRKPYSYVMSGRQLGKSYSRPTADNPPDHRVEVPVPRQLSTAELRAMTRPGATDPRLRPADRWLERWAATGNDVSAAIGPLSFAAVTIVPRTLSAGAPPLDEREGLLVDGIVRASPSWAKTFAVLWYRSASTVEEIAESLKIRRRRAVYEERELVLAYYLGRFSEVGLQVTFWVDPREW
jgi:hypothetical protein